MKSVVVFFLFLPFLLQGQSITKAELMGQFDPKSHPDFTRIESQFTPKQNIYLRKECYEAFKRMHAAAAADGVNLLIVSATRNFQYQKGIWERKWDRPQYMGWQDLRKAKDILTYSSMPGSSRHHWGTDIDLNKLNNSWFDQGEGKKIYDWLVANAADYGFHQVYTSKETGRTGYNEEKWHWSYLPLAGAYLKAFNDSVNNEDFEGFSGSKVAKDIRIKENYVNGIEE